MQCRVPDLPGVVVKEDADLRDLAGIERCEQSLDLLKGWSRGGLRGRGFGVLCAWGRGCGSRRIDGDLGIRGGSGEVPVSGEALQGRWIHRGVGWRGLAVAGEPPNHHASADNHDEQG